MGSGAVQSGGSSSSFTIVDTADNVQFVLDGRKSFIYGGPNDTMVIGGTLTSFHEFTTDSMPIALADFTGFSIDAAHRRVTDVQMAPGRQTARLSMT